ncbi:MAG: Hsp20/alpha crystallin family protein [Acidobacteriota bacterium]|nr:Hsp20/alpha crystallin family protein [Acidobacteriota bacterium]
MSLSHYDPLAGLRQFEDAFTRFFNEPQTNRPWAPAVDIYETDNELVLKADLPDVELKDLDVRVENQTLTITGERKFDRKENAKGYHRVERSYGTFARSFAVPSAFDTEKIGASFKNGVLSVTLPKKEAAKPRQIKVEIHA